MEPGSDQTILFAVIAAVVGIVLGYIFGRRTAPGSREKRELEEKLEDMLAQKRHFEERVTEHFSQSAEKLNRLTEQYRDVHQHLAAGADALCNTGASAAFVALEAPATPAEPPAIEVDDVVMEAPRDYAPKASPEAPGVLNERFGLDAEDAPPASASTPRS